MSRWSIGQDLQDFLREHSWVWKAPFLATTMTVWVGALLLSFGLWPGESNGPNRAKTLPAPALIQPDNSLEEREPLGAASSIPQAIDRTVDRVADDGSGSAAESTEVTVASPIESAAGAAPAVEVPVAAETADGPDERPNRSSSSPTPAPPTVTTTAPPVVTAPTLPRPPTVTIAPPTTRPPAVTIPRPTAPPVTQPPTVPTTVSATTTPASLVP